MSRGATSAPQHDQNQLQKKLRRQIGKAIADYSMIGEGERVMVCVSGGKDSYALLDILINLQQAAPVEFSLVAVNMDQKQPDFPADVLPDYMAARGIEFHCVEKDTYRIVKELTPEGKSFCAVCSRLRRGSLYGFARELGATRIALGHHLDDVVETLFLNMFFGSRLKAMPPKLKSDDGRNVVIRPLYYCRERDIERWAQVRDFPIIPCNLCGSQQHLQRQVIKKMLRDWDERNPGRVENIARSLRNVSPSQLGDPELFDFASLIADTDRELVALQHVGD
jgi:tRNA 2-thiocytidine biosynthesis protein TtcA